MTSLTRCGLALAAAWLAMATTLRAHPVPFSFLDVRLAPHALEATLVVHITDVAHELGVASSERLLDSIEVGSRSADLARLVAGRLRLTVNGTFIESLWTGATPLPERQSIRLTLRQPLDGSADTLTIEGRLFPYDANHKTFVNVYEGEGLTQAIMDRERIRFDYFAGTRQGRVAVVRTFVPAGVHHILIGPDHLLFLMGLLLLGGTLKRLALIVTAFTLAHSVTLSLAALGILAPPSRVIEPAIALSIVYVGVDNLLVRGGRDYRAWIAFAFGFIHGFGFANVLREMSLPPRALGWSLFSFNVGVELGQLVVVVATSALLALLAARHARAHRQVVVWGSIFVIAAGVYWFIQRIVFPGGLS